MIVVPGMRPMAEGLEELVLNRTWRPALSVTGAEGLPLPARRLSRACSPTCGRGSRPGTNNLLRCRPLAFSHHRHHNTPRMRRHVVRPFGVVDVGRVAVGRQAR